MKRTKVAIGVYDDAYGRAITVKVHGKQVEERYPRDTPIKELERHRARLRSELLEAEADRDAQDDPEPIRGTFIADATRYLKQREGRPSYKADRSHLAAWYPSIGHLRRGSIRPSHITAQIAAWTVAKKSARTIRHRVRVLRELYQALDGAHAHPPVKGVALPRVPAPSPMPVPLKTIRAVAASLKKGKPRKQGGGIDSELAYVRFLVRATTGQRPTQIAAAKPDDIDLKRKIWFVRPAKGGHPVPFPLSPEMVRAWKAFAAANAWGTFDQRSFSKTLRRHGWPAHIRPYTLRHTFAIDHILQGTPLEDVQGLLGHKSISTTRMFYGPVQLALLKKAVGRRRLNL